MIRQGSGAVALLVFSCSIPAHGEMVALAPVVVTATRTAETVDETLSSVTVIDRQEIERRQVLSVEDALQGLAGVGVARNGGFGKNASVFLRGTQSGHVLVLIDGVKVGSATLGTTAFQDIPIEQVERIEVVRGPRSSLYGSEAIGGVIQIFTRRGGGPTRPYFSLGAGSNSTSSLSAGLSGGGERGWFNLGVSNFDTQGFNSCSPPNAFSGCFAIEPDDDGFRNRSGSLQAGYRFENGAEVDFHALRGRSKNEFDGSFVNEARNVQQVLGGKLKFSPLAPWRVTLAGGQSRDESDNFLNGMSQSAFDTARDVFSIQNDLALGASQVLTLGYDHQRDRVSSNTPFTVDSRRNDGIFAQYLGQFGAHGVQASVRRDDNEQFGNEVTGSLGWGYQIAPWVRATASFGSGFKAPTFNDLFFPGFGNPNLDPEKSRSFEVGANGSAAGVRWSVNAFHTRIDDLIAFDAATFTPGNIAEARILGLELVASGKPLGFEVSGNVTLLDPENRSTDANRGNVLPRRAEESARLEVDRRFGAFRIGTSLFYEGRRFDDLANTIRLGSYATVDVRAEYTLFKAWTLQARVANLLDKDYQSAAFFNQDGRSFFVTLRYQPPAN